MGVYVDPVRKTQRGGRWHWKEGAHLTADTVEELVAFGGQLGLKKSWLQNTWTPHYDVTPGMRRKAIRLGAVPVGHATLEEISRKAGLLKFGPKPPRRDPRMGGRQGDAETTFFTKESIDGVQGKCD